MKRFFLGNLICCYSTIVVIISSISLGLFSEEHRILDLTVESWKFDPIIELKFICINFFANSFLEIPIENI